MEYCPEGTLEQLVTSSESGLSECLVRRFTRQLLQVSKEQLVTCSESGLRECLVRRFTR
jgi:serine/threonine protein kinase